jgi:tetratricopeptide (TPR) repeat protein
MKRGRGKREGVSPSMPPRAVQPVTIEQATGLAHQHWNSGDADRAERICNQILSARPDYAEALHLLGLIAHAKKDGDGAIHYLVEACRAPGARALFHSNLAEMYRQSGRLGEAEDAARRAVAQDAGLTAGWNNLGIVLQERGKLDKLEESRRCLERAAALSPGAADIQSNLGNTLKKLGELRLARQRYERALELDPNYAVALSNFAATLNELGEYERARTHAERALTIAPGLVDAHINAAAIETSVGRHELALYRLDGAHSLAPDNVRVLVARADALRSLDRPIEALRDIERALALEPMNGDACNSRALILQALRRYEEALAEFDRAASLMPQPATAIANKGALLMEIGQPDGASAAFGHALSLQPNLASAWYNRADGKRFSEGDPDIAAMSALLEPGRVQSFEHRMSLHFALGKAWLDIGDPERAFAHLGEGNSMKRATLAYDAALSAQWIDSIATQFSPELFDRWRGAGEPSQTPIFVIGMPRSGTTLIEQILASHPQVHGAGELPHLRRSILHMLGANDLPSYPEAAGVLQAAHLAQIGRDYLDKTVGLAPRAGRIVDKLPGNFLYAGLIPLVLPGARIIHCRRDAMDVCLSCYSKLFAGEHEYSYDLVELGLFHRSYDGLMRHWRQTLPNSAFLQIDYEAVIDDLEEQARRLIEFCGLPWDEACLSFHATRRPVRTASMNQVRQPIYRSSVGRWRAYRAHLEPLLAALGD